MPEFILLGPKILKGTAFKKLINGWLLAKLRIIMKITQSSAALPRR